MSNHSLQAPSPEALAELIPQYAIDSFIAQGGMGAVYRGRQISLDRDVAIKVLLNEFGGDEQFRESFTTEAKAMARLSHSNLLGVFDYGNVDGMPYIVMEYIEGGSLHEAAWNKVIEPKQAVEIVKGICNGLAHAHEHGIIHRDIKPANILLTPKAEPKVADFGLAHASDSNQSGLTMGTPGYTAPEVFRDASKAGYLADIYSVGVIFHQLLTGIDPAGVVEPPSQATGKIHLDAIWRKATHINPDQRYKNISEMVADLEKWSDSKLAVPSAANAAVYAPQIPVTPKSNNGSGMFLRFTIICALLAGIAFTYHLTQEKEEKIASLDNTSITKFEDIDVPSAETLPEEALAVIPDPVEEIKKPVPETTEPKIDSEVANNNTTQKPVIPEVVKKGPVKKEPLKKAPPEELLPGDLELRERAIGFIKEARMKRDHNYDRKISSEQEALDKAYLARLEVIREAYVSRLNTGASEAADPELKSRLLAQAARAENLDTWIASLSPEPKKKVKKVPNDIVGNWDQHAEGRVTRWTAHADGRMEIVGKDWEVTWEIIEDGTLVVEWGKIRPFTYTRNGDDWTGITTFGKPTTLKRGNW